LEDFASQDRFMTTLKSEIDAQNGATRLGLEAKFSSLSLEVERVRKLLEIRPTTSELQKVMLAVNDNEQKIQRIVGEFTGTMQSMVKDKVSLEMSSILDRLKANTTSNEKGIHALLHKVDGFSSEVSALKGGVEKTLEKINQRIADLRDINTQSTDELLQFRAEMEAANRRMQATVSEGQRSYKEVADTLTEHRHLMQDKFDSITTRIDRNAHSLAKIVAQAEETEHSLRDSIAESKGHLDSFRAMYQLDADDHKQTVQEITRRFNELDEKQNDIDVLMDNYTQSNVLNRLVEIEKRLGKGDETVVCLDGKILEVSKGLEEQAKNLSDLAATLGELPSRMDAEENRSRFFDRDVKEVKEFNKRLYTALTDLQSQLEDLSTVRDEISVVRDIATGQEQMVKAQQATVQHLLETGERRDRLMHEMDLAVKQNEDKATKKINDIYREMMTTVVEKQQETQEKMQSIQDNVEVMIQSVPSSHPHPHGALTRQDSMRSKGHGSVMSREETLSHIEDKASFVAELCVNYEETAIRKNNLPDLSDMLCESLAMSSLELAQAVASAADSDAIQTMLRSRGDEVEYQDVILAKRRLHTNDFLRSVIGHVEENKSKPGVIRSEAREKFLKQVQKAIEVALSKYDQVLLPGNTRFGRVKIPTCIACDRPLASKVRQDSPVLDDSLSMNRSIIKPGSPPTTAPSSLVLNPLSDNNRPLKMSMPVRLPAPRNEGPGGSFPSRSELSKSKSDSASGVEGESYVMRGGFKMPKTRLQSIPSDKDFHLQASRSGYL